MHELQDYSYALQQALARLSGRLMQELTHTTSRRPPFISTLRGQRPKLKPLGEIMKAFKSKAT
ncbi:MAG: hypothetical protein AAB363_07365, partial [Planctomycetota bacterium]